MCRWVFTNVFIKKCLNQSSGITVQNKCAINQAFKNDSIILLAELLYCETFLIRFGAN